MSSVQQQHQQQTRSSKSHEAEFKAVNDQLDAIPAHYDNRCRRESPRLNYRRSSILVQVVQRSGAMTPLYMASRDISATGMCLLHAGFLHTGTNCIITLKKRLGGEERVHAMVVRCRHAAGVVHSLRVKFDKPIWVKHFLEPEECKGLITTANTDPAQLSGTVLMLDDQPVDRSLLAFHLKKTKCTFVPCATIAEATAAVAKGRVDVILCDLNLGSDQGEAAITAFRQAGYRGMIVAMTAETEAGRLKAAQQAGANEIFAKPYDAQRLYAYLAAWLNPGGPTNEQQQPIYSTLPEAAEMGELLEQYIAEVTKLTGLLQAAINTNNAKQVRLICQNLMGSGTGYGFTPLTEAARDALQALDASQSVNESQTELQLVDSVARRLSPGAPGNRGGGPTAGKARIVA